MSYTHNHCHSKYCIKAEEKTFFQEIYITEFFDIEYYIVYDLEVHIKVI